jgi:hypothetical protein
MPQVAPVVSNGKAIASPPITGAPACVVKRSASPNPVNPIAPLMTGAVPLPSSSRNGSSIAKALPSDPAASASGAGSGSTLSVQGATTGTSRVPSGAGGGSTAPALKTPPADAQRGEALCARRQPIGAYPDRSGRKVPAQRVCGIGRAVGRQQQYRLADLEERRLQVRYDHDKARVLEERELHQRQVIVD